MGYAAHYDPLIAIENRDERGTASQVTRVTFGVDERGT
jgi:hypothetical protein